MSCNCKETNPTLVEMAVKEDSLPPSMKGWRCYRIKYGFECSCPEGIIYLPKYAEPLDIESVLHEMKRFCQ